MHAINAHGRLRLIMVVFLTKSAAVSDFDVDLIIMIDCVIIDNP